MTSSAPPVSFMSSMARVSFSSCVTSQMLMLQPLAQSGDFYSDYIAGCDGFVIKHHHFGMLLDSREAMAETRAAHVGQGNAIVYEGGETGAAVQYLYADCRGTMGHYLEYLRLEEGGRQMFAAIPGSPFA